MKNAPTPESARAAGSARAHADQALERKVERSRWMLFLERMWPRVWLLLAVVIAFVGMSMLGVWAMFGPLVHKGLLALFAVAMLAAAVVAIRTPWPSRDEGLRRLEKLSGVPHRPASSYDDTLSAGDSDPATRAVWQAHRQRLSELLGKLRVAAPHPDTPRHDPWALRAALLVGVVALIGLSGEQWSDRLTAAFRFEEPETIASRLRIDAWITPPGYTTKPPVMLADGGKSAKANAADIAALGLVEVPQGSELIVRTSGEGASQVRLEISGAGEDTATVAADAAKTVGGVVKDVAELRGTLKTSARVRLMYAEREVAAWTFSVISDNPPTIELTETPKPTSRGSMKLDYKVADDYGVAAARLKIVKAEADRENPATAWARKETLQGPRLPLSRPPEFSLLLPKANAREGEGVTHLELGSHPWAGLKVVMTLEATDAAGQTGSSKSIEMDLPQRIFKKPFARAIIEQRRKLVEDSRNSSRVVRALDALTMEPDGFIDDVQVYLGLRTASYRLQRDNTRPGLDSVIEQLWNVAIRIEDGDLSDAERRLREAQDKLSKMLQEGAEDAELKEAMDELRTALNEYLQKLAQEAKNNPAMPDGQDSDQQQLSQDDIERMMKEIEEMAKSGAREAAQQMLSELRDMLDRLQSAEQQAGQGELNVQQMEMMKELGDVVGKQQRLMDDTFSEQRKEGQQGEQQGQQGQQQGQQRRGPQGQGQQGQQGQQQGQGQKGPPGSGQLGERQQSLRNRLGELQRDMRGAGMGSSKEIAEAQEAMRNAEQALKEGNLEGAMQEQSRALDKLRKGAQEMAQEMMKNMPQRFGQNGDTPRDPLGRPQRSTGPDQGSSVKVPDEIDTQRARELLNELRRRLGEAQRPAEELDYIERLLRFY
ncbi:MAG: TIGR02302 family protein [Alphaproteobacteria bacterium]|nr:TIGR02302 family protein [Alphaproteobacteria bacterium]